MNRRKKLPQKRGRPKITLQDFQEELKIKQEKVRTLEESLKLMQARTSDEQIDESEIDEYNELMATDDDYTVSESSSYELEPSESDLSESCSPEGAFQRRKIVIETKLIEIYIVSVSVVQSFGAAESAALLSSDSCPTQAVRDSPHNSLDSLIEASESNFDELVDMNGSVDELDPETAFSIGTEIIETSTPSVLMVRTADSIEMSTERSSTSNIVSECFTSNPLLFIEETITDNPERLHGQHIRSTETSKG